MKQQYFKYQYYINMFNVNNNTCHSSVNESMPHFVIECSKGLFHLKSANEIMQAVYDVADASGIFAEGDIKVRIQPFEHYKLGEDKENFLHVFAYIMEGRTDEQKTALSRAVITKLNDLLPALSILSMNVSEFEKATYCNKALLHPKNTSGDRHFSAHKS